MSTIKLYKRDFILGIKSKWYMYIYIIIITALLCVQTHLFIDSMEQADIYIKNASFWDYWLACIAGQGPIDHTANTPYFIPSWWLGVQLGIHYLIAYYASSDYKKSGAQVISSGSPRLDWWLSKCAWCFTVVLIYYGLMFVTTFVLHGILEKNFSLVYDIKLALYNVSGLIKYMTKTEVIMCSLVIPIIITFGISLLQIFLSFLIDATASFGVICAYYIFSSYTTSKFLLGNYTMFLRYEKASVNGLPMTCGIVGGFLVICIVIIVGMLYFEKKDII